MKNYLLARTSLLLAILVIFSACSDEFQEMDTRLVDREISFRHVDPTSGEMLVNVFENAFRQDDNVQVEIESDYRISKIGRAHV